MKKQTEREIVTQQVKTWLETDLFPDRLSIPDERHRAFVVEVVYGVVRHLRTLRWYLKPFIRQETSIDIEAVLLCGIYQLAYMDRSAVYAIVNETVAIAKKQCGPGPAKMVNAVLRSFERERDTLNRKLSREDIGVQSSHPDMLVQRWMKAYGDRKTRQLCEWDNTIPGVIIRPLVSQISTQKLIEHLNNSDIAAKQHPGRSDCIMVPRGIAVHTLPGFKEGWFIVQDPSTLTAIDLLAPCSGEHILDACAAPGGKAVAIWEAMKREGVLVAMDKHDDRLAILNDNIKRLGIHQVIVLKGDATSEEVRTVLADHRSPALFDGVLLDVPCSNTGVLRRRIDARWRFSNTRLKKMVAIQNKILYAMSRMVKPGGRLVYSTCSIEPEEDENMISRWLSRNPEFKQIKAKKLFPGNNDMDGGYAVLLKRKDD